MGSRSSCPAVSCWTLGRFSESYDFSGFRVLLLARKKAKKNLAAPARLSHYFFSGAAHM
jgi:hypothetical protein